MKADSTSSQIISNGDSTELSNIYDGFIEDEIRLIYEEDKTGYYTAYRAIETAIPYKYRPLMYWIIGARRIGKTDHLLNLAIRLFNKYGIETAWLRNKKTELSDDDFFRDFLNDAIELGWCTTDWIVDSAGVHTPDKQRVIKWQSISTFSNRRGAGHPNCYLIVYDEFCPEDRKYPKHALTALMSLTKTIIAGKREARVFCLSNFVSLANPFFAGLEIYPDGYFTHYPDKMMMIEKCHGYTCSIADDNPWQNVYRAAKYGDYADESEDTLIELIKPKLNPKKEKYMNFALLIRGSYYLPYEASRYIHWVKSNNVPYGSEVFAADITEVSDKVPLCPDLLKKNIEKCVESDAIRFDSPNTLYSVLSIIYNV